MNVSVLMIGRQREIRLQEKKATTRVRCNVSGFESVKRGHEL